jgi:hypothetical protein
VPIITEVVSFNPVHGEVYSIQHNVIKFVSDWRQVGGFFMIAFTNTTDRHNIAELLLKVALNTITITRNKEHVFIFYINIQLILYLANQDDVDIIFKMSDVSKL